MTSELANFRSAPNWARADRWLEELRIAVREFVPQGGLYAWRVQVKWTGKDHDPESRIRIHATVPDVKRIGREIKIGWIGEPALALAMQEDLLEPRQYLRKILHDFVTHEADESIGFREMPRAGSALFLNDNSPSTKPAISKEVKRPFDPHAKDDE